jgi:hypothetical protein
MPALTERETMRHPNSEHSRPRTGERKIYVDNRCFADKAHVDVSAMNIRMMRIDENIHATHPPYATVAPILHKQTRNKLAKRNTTLNHGATDADGR